MSDALNLLGASDSDDFFDPNESEDETSKVVTKKTRDVFEDSDDEPEPANEDELTNLVSEEKRRNTKLKKLTPEQLAKEEKRLRRTGVCYLSSIPPFMKPAKLRSVLSQFGELDRIFLKPESEHNYKKRRRMGGNKKRKFTEGWVEFVKKKHAKTCAETLNGNILGGKKLSYYHDDIINIKYLSGFKWLDLTRQMAKENEARQAKLTLEISQQQKLNKTFVSNVEKLKSASRKRKRDEEEGKVTEPKVNRQFDQKVVASTRANAGKEFKKDTASGDLNSVLSQVF